MRIALVHDSLTAWGGAERVLQSLIDIFPEADLFTSLADPKVIEKLHFKSSLVYSELSRCPWAIKHTSWTKPYFYHYYWRRLDLDAYDLVISSSHSFCANWVKVKNYHISYIHTPPRFLYQGVNQLAWLKRVPWAWLAAPYLNYLRHLDCQHVSRIDLLLANSNYVQKRIQKTYQGQARVLYPPLADWTNGQKTSKNNFKQLPKNYYLFFSRLSKQKGTKLLIDTFNQLKKPLVVVGQGRQMKQMKKLAKANIHFVGFVPDDQLFDLVNQAQALIYPAIEEDLGLVPLEVLRVGKPVIAYRSGGPLETLNDQCTVWFDDYQASALIQAIKTFEKRLLEGDFSPSICRQQVNNWPGKHFKKELLQLVRQHVKSSI